MTIVKDEIESLKRIQAELYQKGITRFNSIGDIKAFKQNYASEKEELVRQVVQEVDHQLEAIKIDKVQLQKAFDILETKETTKLQDEVKRLSARHEFLLSKEPSFFVKAVNSFRILFLEQRKARLEKNFNKIILKKTFKLAGKVEARAKEIEHYTVNRSTIIADRVAPKTRLLDFTKEVVDNLYPLIAGAVGERKVVEELKKLSDRYILFNDFSIRFNKPIYNRKENDRIYSIQIDHLLVSNSGIFILETKNWSKESIENLDLRSPVEQVKRTSYALFTILNSNSGGLGPHLRTHHWGDKQIPIRNLIVMINHKPREKFKFVKVKTLNELNDYISYFDPIFDDAEVQSISSFLEGMKNEEPVKRHIHRDSKRNIPLNQSQFESLTKPTLLAWLKENPGKGINDYYSKFGKS